MQVKCAFDKKSNESNVSLIFILITTITVWWLLLMFIKRDQLKIYYLVDENLNEDKTK